MRERAPDMRIELQGPVPGIEPRSSRTRSANHTTRPHGQLAIVSYTRYHAVPLRVTRRLGWRSDIVGCQSCGGPAWHWLDASPGMTLARSWGTVAVLQLSPNLLSDAAVPAEV